MRVVVSLEEQMSFVFDLLVRFWFVVRLMFLHRFVCADMGEDKTETVSGTELGAYLS